jgi:hypothetical protein
MLSFDAPFHGIEGANELDVGVKRQYFFGRTFVFCAHRTLLPN